jgi:hypothetical protein
MKFGAGDLKLRLQENSLCCSASGGPQKTPLGSGKGKLFSRQDGQIPLGKVEGLKDIGPAEDSADGTFQGMIIP